MGVTYKLKRKTGANTTEEVLFPIASVDGLQTALNGKLGTSAKAADSAKLNGQAASYYLNYTNLTSKPTIPTATSQLTNDSGFLTTETYKGTVTSVKVGTTSYTPSSGVVSLPAYPTVPTQTSQLTNNSDFATNASVDTKIANLVNSAPEALDTLGELATALQTHEDAYDALLTTVGGKVDKVSGKGLSTNDYTTAEKNKLAGIAAGAEVNVQSDWNATSGDAFIKNKPTIPSVGNGTITIKQAGAVKGTFTTNQSGATTIELTDTNTTVLPTRLAASSTSGYNDANLAVEQGWHYMSSTGTNRPPFKQVDGQTGNDYRIMTTAYGSTWLQQIATDFRSNDMFIRRCQNGTWQAWTPIVKMGQGATPLPTDNALPRWDATRNATLQSSGVIVDDSNNMSGVATLTATKFVGAAATQSDAGLMSAADKTKLDGIATGANNITVDSFLSSSSTNPVQNKIINTALSNKAPAKSGSYFVNGTQTASTNAWTGTLTGITPYDGLAIRYYLPYAGTSSGATLSLNGGTAYPVYRLGTTTQITTHFAAGSVIAMTFRTSYNVAGTTKTNAWICEAYYDTNNAVGQHYTTTNANYPLLYKYESGVTSTSTVTNQTRYANNIYVNPSTGTIYANDFVVDGKSIVGGGSNGIRKIAADGELNLTSSTVGAYFKIAGSVAGATEFYVGEEAIVLDSSYDYFISVEGILKTHVSANSQAWKVMVIIRQVRSSSLVYYYAFHISTTAASGVYIGDDVGGDLYSGILCE